MSKNSPNNVEIGDFVQKQFSEEGEGTENMWVEVTEIKEDSFIGNLNNDPVFVDLNCGDEVTVKFTEVRQHMKA